MSKTKLLLLATLSIAGIANAYAQPQKEDATSAAEQVSIPFVNNGSIFDWRANKREGLWIQDIHRRWYYAETMGPCYGLDFANYVGFDAKPMGTLDRFSAVIVPNEMRCPFKSLTRSEAPPPRKPRKASKAEPTT
jgi:Family of unknown function (DUF6491)